MDEFVRESAQEKEIENLLAEEFCCDSSFGRRFLAAAKRPIDGFETLSALPQPSLGGGGRGDLLVEGIASGERIGLLVEIKITAGAPPRQAARYKAHAERMRGQGWDRVLTVLAAPHAYKGEGNLYDSRVDLEAVAALLHSPDPVRQTYRRGIIDRALTKHATTGVQVPDPALHRLKAEYIDFVTQWCAANEIELSLPPLRESYAAEDSWFEHIRHPRLPKHIELRHRLWLSVSGGPGQVDLIARIADDAERARFRETAPEGASVATFGNTKAGEQVSLLVPALRQATGFDPAAATEACQAMRRLVEWYLGEPV